MGTGKGQEVARPPGKEAADYFGAKSRDLYALREARLDDLEIQVPAEGFLFETMGTADISVATNLISAVAKQGI